MHYELKDTSLNGHLSVSTGFDKTSSPFVLSCYTFVWNQGNPKQWEIDLIPVELPSNTIFSLSPGQTISTSQFDNDLIVIQFNREFYCVQDHDHEVSCNGLLFNGVLSTPMLKLDENEQHSFNILLEVLLAEFSNEDEVQVEMQRTVLKSIIIKCTRLAKLQFADTFISLRQLNIARYFSALVEKHFRTLHKVSDYAELMHKSPKTLSNVFRTMGERTPLQIIHNRIILESKKLLLFTDKSAKEIAFELNFSDPVQFARLFKNETGATPGEFKRQGLLRPLKAN